ncbi:major facilitator superfamily MFS_1 [Parvibaculum lavamentivorans DS-1]|uniref:Major facilitator superfamily MFS_1 n=1 Tax=Parvibaculum lavamentivorans (strain DS-1 / DSM 13023 / NCIMB 13966) TaxID=402881 RepID=A7HXU4_PARL1|nr:MFS transporter [Parvibaculum lavamentivorans]ABS64727.1 major facilitator superfamily MFS_1 [Parvibaculum lavamentivorans DS-1]
MEKHKVTRWQIAAFGLPSIPISALGLPIVVYLPPFYAHDMGLSLTVVGTVFMMARFWDVITDPVLGMVSDRFPSRWGRRRHWIVISAPLLLISAYMLFMPTPPVTWVYLAGWMFFLYIGWTLITISHMSWGAELSADYDERSTIQGMREFLLIFGMFTVLALPAIIESVSEAGAGGAEKVAAMGWFIIILLPITIGLAVWVTPEFPSAPHQQIPWKRAWGMIMRNRLLQRVLVADLLVNIAPAITGSLYIFFASHVMGLPKSASLLLLIYFIAGFVGIPAWIRMSHIAGKHKTLAIAMVYGAVTLPLVVFFPRGEFWWLFVGNSLYGVAYGAGSFLLRSIMADVIDTDYLETGQRRTGLYYSLLSMTAKVGAALAVGITYPLLDLIQFTPGGENSPETLNQFMALYVAMPALVMLAAAFVMWRFPLDRAAQLALRRKIEERDGKHRAHEASDAAAAVAAVGTAGGVIDPSGD